MASKKPKNFFYKHPFFIGMSVFLVILLITQAIAFQRYLLNLSEIEKENTEELNTVVDQLQFNLNYALSTTRTLSFIVENYGMPQNFDTIAKKLLEANDLVDGIQLLEKGVITKMYPLEGNEVVIGYDVVNDPSRGKEVLIAAQKDQMYFGGPFELKQGGLGVVGRVPLKVENDSLAFAAVVIRLEKLFEKSGINNKSNRFEYQLSKMNQDTRVVEYFIDSNEDFSESQVAVINVPLGEWQIYVKEKKANYFEGVIPIAVLGLVLSLLGGNLTRVVLRKPIELEEQVKLQTEIIFGKEKRYRALVENSNDAVAILNKKGTPIYVSPSITSVLGYSESEALKLNLINLVHPEDLPNVAAVLEEVLDSPEVSINSPIVRVQHKDGSWRWVDATLTNLLDDPNVKGIIDNFRDITERKQAEENILREKQLSEAILNSLPGIFYLFNQNGEFLLWNKNFEEVSEYSAKEIKKMHPTEFFEGDDQKHIQERIMETFEKGESFAEAYFTSKSGKKIYHYFTGSLIDFKGETCLLGTGIDTSKRRKAEEELEKSEEQLLSIFNNSISALILMDAEGMITNWNATAEQMFGWKAEEVLNKPMHHFIMPEKHVQSHLAGMENYNKTGSGPIINTNTELTAITKAKKEIDISLGVTTVKIRGKEFFIGFINDITLQKQAERQKEYEKRNREALINATEDMIWSVSKKMTLISANEAFKKSFKIYSEHTIKEGDFLLPDEFFEADYLNMWKTYYQRGLEGERFTIETTVQPNEKQNYKTVETNFSPIIVNNEVVGVACYARDITQRIKTEAEIKEYNERLKTAQKIAKLGYWEHVLGEDTLFWSEEIFNIWEVDEEVFTPTIDSFFESVVPEDRNKFNLYAKRPIDSIEEQNIEYRIITATGKLKWIYQYGQKIVDKNNDRTIFKGIMRDITEQKNQEEAILEYNEKLQTAQQIAKLGYWEFDYNNDALTWSDQVYEIWELSKKDFKVSYETFFNSIHPDDQERFSLEQEKALKGEKPLEVEHRILLSNGKTKWVLERGKVIKDENGNAILFEGTVQDITSQKEIEIELREQNNFIKTAIDNLPVGIAVRNSHTGKFTLMNKNFTQIYGWSQKELRDVDTFFEKVYPDSNYRKKIKDQIFSDLGSKNLNRMQWEGIQITTKKGDKRIVNARNIPLYDQNLMISTVLDVTEKALAEQKLAASNERYEYVTKATFDAIWDWDLTQKTIFWGEGYHTIFGYKPVTTNEEYWYENIHPQDVNRVKQSVQKAIEGQGLNWENEYRFKHANGTYRYVRDRGIILRNVERKAIRIIGALQDITSQKEYEQKLLDVNQKLRNLSAHLQQAREEERIAIAREIHDELGQQLTGIKLDVSWLKNKLEEVLPENSDRAQRLIENINKTINDVRKIASHLRPGVLDDLGLEAAIDWQSNQFETQTGIKCQLHIDSVKSDYGKGINTSVYRIYQEALTNIMRHAKATEVNTYFSEKNNTLILEVIDNGVGISDNQKNNSFSLGITGMRERAFTVNGSFHLYKQKEGGTKLKVTVPV
ncbi:PAS domain S-box protein [Planktosalinus lacus]|uniref:histidine kinase n=1 Tax=Planktosalinus lacus TaxID=1526573 RepID=A0A8J2V9P7_9FLAO|nr:PAS domain S-box protein [Planktosalinus lacus]GGD92425.1 hypothetical protein GCM10011312_15320 [Planktosalinus lacus]